MLRRVGVISNQRFPFYFYQNVVGVCDDRPSLAAVSYGPDKYIHLMPFTLLRFKNETVNLVGTTYTYQDWLIIQDSA